MRLPLALLVATFGLAACSKSGGGKPLGPSGQPDSGTGPAQQGGPDAAPGEADSGTAANAPDSGAIPSYTWWRDVQPIVAARCQLCHGNPPLYGSPRSLVTYRDTQIPSTTGEVMYKVMAFKVVARMDAMPPPDQPQLTTEQKQIIVDWAAEGAPEGDRPEPAPDSGSGGSGDTGSGIPDSGTTVTPDSGTGTPDSGTAGGGDAGQGGSPTVFDFTTRAAGSTAPYMIPVADTQYTCWAFNIPTSISGRQHGVRFEPVVVNTMHLHHMLLFRNSQGNAAAGPTDCTSWPYQWELVGGWAPGRTAVDMPQGVGIPVNAGDQFVLQAHFNGVTTSDQVDQSGFRMTVVDTPGMIDAGMLWSGVIFGSAISGPNVTKTGECTLSSPITIFSDFPHMHRTGTHITLDLERSGSTTYENLVDVQPWSFDAQPNSPIPSGQQMLNSGDKLRTTCWWDTMGRSINYGEASSDEMCFNFVYHYPLMSNQYACVSLSP